MTITEFLLDRIAEDEERATFVQRQQLDYPQPIGEGYQWWEEYDLLYVPPARTIAECQAKRAIIEEHQMRAMDGVVGCVTCEWRDDFGWEQTGPCNTFRHLAAVYADHPDYDRRWKIG